MTLFDLGRHVPEPLDHRDRIAGVALPHPMWLSRSGVTSSLAMPPQKMRRRELDEGVVQRVLQAPEQRTTLRAGRDVLQARFELAGKHYLVRVFVDVDRTPPEVVTAYRTSKVGKYWRGNE